MAKIRATFSDTKKCVESLYDDLIVGGDHIELRNVRTYVDHDHNFEPSVSLLDGLDFDGDIVYMRIGLIYFDAVDRIEIFRDDGPVQVLFSKAVY